MLITEFTRALQRTVPLESKGYDKDALGLQVGLDNDARVKKALFAYEVTEAVIQEAKDRGANIIIAFHPLIFPNVSAITNSTRTGKLIRDLVRSEIALYVQHTAFDAQIEFGTSQLMADVLELDNVKPLAPLRQSLNKITVFTSYAFSKTVMEALIQSGAGRVGSLEACSFQIEGRGQFKSHEIETNSGEPAVLEGIDEVRLEMVCDRWNTQKALAAIGRLEGDSKVLYDVTSLETESQTYGMGAIGVWEKPKSRQEFIHFVSEAFGSKALRHNGSGPEEIQRVAMLGGAGMEFYRAATAQHADAFITADVRYHDFYQADHDNILLVDAGHAETERFVTRGMLRAAQQALDLTSSTNGIGPEALLVSEVEPNSVRYYCKEV